ncbi:DUF6311 domain-containing protein [Candidatus Pantoea floridensis]|uniref:Glucosyl transferase GtrII n=1 Tax=Candidatus Pantoea floridensis TaxID=1938870 RepID=A0A286BXJ3_9GAMM|nr:DUF6311 domain-containing protein [Pantoea floridensis]PIF21355.1 hypothetical protein BX596_0749 [Enterobacteriaceae bacterium JKS000233]SOD38867.1 hypothetical protein SAMN06273570_3302 [Pantoea floridensis]
MKYPLYNKNGSGNLLTLLFSACLSFLIILLLTPKGFILGTSSYWHTDAEDVTQYIAGFNYYFISDWHFPLLAFDSLNYPDGTRATFVDVIPLYSFLLKVFLPNSLYPFNPFGYWVAFCFIMQGVGAWFIAKELKINCLFTSLALSALLTSFPALLFRLGHISLMSHWILLFSLAFYFRAKRTGSLSIAGITILLFVSFYINIYLFVMASLIYASSIMMMLSRCYSLKKILLSVLPFFFVLISMLIFLFPLPPGGGARDSGFGFYSMNLLSPFVGGTLFDIRLPVMSGQYEGFNYLGLGVIFLLASCIIFFRDTIKISIKENIYLFSTLCLLTIYSLSGDVYFSNVLVLKLYYPAITEAVTSQFRASGRFFWPVGYCLVIYGVYKLFKIESKRYRYLLLAFVVIVQGADLQNQISLFKDRSKREQLEQINYKIWSEDIKNNNIKFIYFYPKFRCGGDPMKALLPIMNLSSKYNVKLNTGYIARYMPDCGNISTEIKNSSKENSLYVFDSNAYNQKDVAEFVANEPALSCNRRDFAYICRLTKGAEKQ